MSHCLICDEPEPTHIWDGLLCTCVECAAWLDGQAPLPNPCLALTKEQADKLRQIVASVRRRARSDRV